MFDIDIAAYLCTVIENYLKISSVAILHHVFFGPPMGLRPPNLSEVSGAESGGAQDLPGAGRRCGASKPCAEDQE